MSDRKWYKSDFTQEEKDDILKNNLYRFERYIANGIKSGHPYKEGDPISIMFYVYCEALDNQNDYPESVIRDADRNFSF